MLQTKSMLPANVGASYSCASCHLAAGTHAHGLSWRGTFAAYPQWNVRAARYITVEDRIAECFLYSMNGKPPAYDSRQMVAMVAYLASLSKGIPVGLRVAGQGLIPVSAPVPPKNNGSGASVFAQRCAMCHGANGDGTGAAPPLWGAHAFNTGAGLHRVDTMAAFVRYNMPDGWPPNTLSAQQAVDVAAFILGHPRPRFNGSAPVIFQPQPARFF